MCFIYSDEAEGRKVNSRFLESGIRSGEHVSYFAENKSLAEVKDWLTELGIAVAEGDAAALGVRNQAPAQGRIRSRH